MLINNILRRHDFSSIKLRFSLNVGVCKVTSRNCSGSVMINEYAGNYEKAIS
jgi:hypothetical protein